MVFCHVSGRSTDGSEKGQVMWARVKGRAENALTRLPFKAVYHFRPGLMKASPGQKNLSSSAKVIKALYPVLKLAFTGLTMAEVGRAMINAARLGSAKTVLEDRDMLAMAKA
jgi:hypothetical protein